jgi:hypothetical protein
MTMESVTHCCLIFLSPPLLQSGTGIGCFPSTLAFLSRLSLSVCLGFNDAVSNSLYTRVWKWLQALRGYTIQNEQIYPSQHSPEVNVPEFSRNLHIEKSRARSRIQCAKNCRYWMYRCSPCRGNSPWIVSTHFTSIESKPSPLTIRGVLPVTSRKMSCRHTVCS